MTPRLSLDVQAAEEGVEIIPTLHNDGDEPLNFTTMSGKLLDISLEQTDGAPIEWSESMYTQAVERRSISPGGATSQAQTWYSWEFWEEFYQDNRRDIDRDEMWEDVPNDYEQVVVTVEVASSDDPVADLTLTKTVELP